MLENSLVALGLYLAAAEDGSPSRSTTSSVETRTTPGPVVSTDAAEMEGLSKLTEFGLLGTLLAIALGAVIWLYGRQNLLWNERLADWKASQEIQQAQTDKINELSNTSEQRTRAQEEAARALQMLSQAHAQHVNELTRMREEVSGLRAMMTEISSLRSDINKLITICTKLGDRP
jgi:uncharacterized protein HemX